MFYIGIDIAKETHVAAILDNEGERIGKHFSVPNSQAGFAKLTSQLLALSADPTQLLCGMEATGNFWEGIYQYLETNGFTVVLLNPYQTKQYKQLTGKKIKTDAIDAVVIAGLLRSGEATKSFIPQAEMREIREAVKLKAHFVKNRNAYKRKLMSLLQVLFPEYPNVIVKSFGKMSLSILAEYQTASDFASLKVEDLVTLAKEAGGRRFSAQTARELITAASTSVASTMGVTMRRIALKEIIAQIVSLNSSIEKLEAQIETLIKTDSEDYTGLDKTLSTIPGVGPKTIASFIAEVGNGSRFKTSTDLIGFIGFYPKISESGNYKNSHPKISHAGPGHLRHALYLAAVACIKHNQEFKALYHAKISQGKSSIQALVIIARKLAIIMLSMLKSGEVYNPRLVFTQASSA